MFTPVNKGENPAPRISSNRQVRTMFTQVNKGENPASRISSKPSIDDNVVEAVCGWRPLHAEA